MLLDPKDASRPPERLGGSGRGWVPDRGFSSFAHSHPPGYSQRGRHQRVEKLPWCSLSSQIGYETASFGAF
jgi:hypothetical protein